MFVNYTLHVSSCFFFGGGGGGVTRYIPCVSLNLFTSLYVLDYLCVLSLKTVG